MHGLKVPVEMNGMYILIGSCSSRSSSLDSFTTITCGYENEKYVDGTEFLRL